jgi:hypothetical protein
MERYIIGLINSVAEDVFFLFVIQVYLIEACLFPLFYIVYIAIVVSMSYARVRKLDIYLHESHDYSLETIGVVEKEAFWCGQCQ